MFFTDGDPKKSSDHLVNADAAKDDAAISARGKVVNSRHGKLKTVKESEAAPAVK